MREVDSAAVSKSTIFVDTYAAVQEAGDLVVPLTESVICRHAIVAELADLLQAVTPAAAMPMRSLFPNPWAWQSRILRRQFCASSASALQGTAISGSHDGRRAGPLMSKLHCPDEV